MKSEFGQDSIQVASSLRALAFVYLEKGKYGDALPLFQRALYIHEKELGMEDTSVAADLDGLATTYMRLRNYDAALPLFQRSLAGA